MNLAFRKLNVNPIVMSAGELESGNAGEPAKLIRQRYREASDVIKKGKMSSMFINDLDAGMPRCSAYLCLHCLLCQGFLPLPLQMIPCMVAACVCAAADAMWLLWQLELEPLRRWLSCRQLMLRMPRTAGAGRMGEGTQYTVNNQMVNATLMNIADNPTNVQMPGVYKEESIPRVPIVCTGNDFSTLYAPLIRDGRMEKFYWAPTREDRVGVCTGIFQVCCLALCPVLQQACIQLWLVLVLHPLLLLLPVLCHHHTQPIPACELMCCRVCIWSFMMA